MKILITGAAGNLGSFLARRLLGSPYQLNLMIHRRPLPFAVAGAEGVRVFRADLSRPETLLAPLAGVNTVVHFAGVLFVPRPERFLPRTNVGFVCSLLAAARAAGVRRFILVSFPHVEGESTPAHPARGGPGGTPASVHARTRLQAERLVFRACRDGAMTPVILRPGMVYGRGVLMIEAARWAARRRLLAVWRRPTWIHLVALPDFLAAVTAAIEKEGISGIYNIGDEAPLTLQQFLDRATAHWGWARPWRLPAGVILAAAGGAEALAALFSMRTPLTRDFIRIGMASYCMNTGRMRQELLPRLEYPTLKEGMAIL